MEVVFRIPCEHTLPLDDDMMGRINTKYEARYGKLVDCHDEASGAAFVDRIATLSQLTYAEQEVSTLEKNNGAIHTTTEERDRVCHLFYLYRQDGDALKLRRDIANVIGAERMALLMRRSEDRIYHYVDDGVDW